MTGGGVPAGVTPPGTRTSTFVDTASVRRNFSRAAERYEHVAHIEREIGSRMLERLDYVRITPTRVVDLGCGSGAASAALRARYPKADLIAIDSSAAMLRASRRAGNFLGRLLPFMKAGRIRRLCADASALPLATGSAQLAWSNLMLPWVEDPLQVFRETHRVLETGGLLMFTAFGPDTLKELRNAFPDRGVHTQRFTDMHDLGDMLVASGFADPVMDMEMLTVTYPDVDALLQDLRNSGAVCAMHDRRRGLTGRGVWEAMRSTYSASRIEGRLPASLEIIYGHAWRGAPRKTADGSAIVRFDRGNKQPR